MEATFWTPSSDHGKEDIKCLEANFLVFGKSMLKFPLIQTLISGWIDLKKHANFCRDCIYFALIRFTRSRGNEYTNTLNNIHTYLTYNCFSFGLFLRKNLLCEILIRRMWLDSNKKKWKTTILSLTPSYFFETVGYANIRLIFFLKIHNNFDEIFKHFHICLPLKDNWLLIPSSILRFFVGNIVGFMSGNPWGDFVLFFIKGCNFKWQFSLGFRQTNGNENAAQRWNACKQERKPD